MPLVPVCHRPARTLSRVRRGAIAIALATSATLSACGLSAPSAPGATSDGAEATTSIVLADGQETGGYNPVRGYGELGVSPLYDGLLRPVAHEDGMPTLAPALAAQEPTPNADFTRWSVRLREGVTFHDGSAFDAADVVATYRTILDPASASDIAAGLDMISDVEADGETVTFTLKYPYVDFPTRLLIGIAPSQAFTGGPAEDSTLNASPIGTGPYRLVELNAQRAVFEANPAYWRGAPQVTRLTTVYVPDDATRAQRMAAGEFDGTSLPPMLAETLADRPGLQVDAAPSADWRGVSLPRDAELTKDPAVRRALNLAVDRDAMVEAILGGRGLATATPLSPVYGAAHLESASFSHDPDEAARLLDEAGWVTGADGIRVKDGRSARLSVAYPPDDTLRRDLATAFAADVRAVGVDVHLEALPFTTIEPRLGELGVLLGGGDRPYSVDTQVFGALHTQVPGSSPWDNPGDHGTPELDTALEAARRTSDDAARTAAYRTVQSEYLTDPSYVFLVIPEHTYVSKKDGWNRPPLILEPHAHGIAWGPWWDLASWTR